MTTPLTDTYLSEIEARLNAATPGPWEESESGEYFGPITANVYRNRTDDGYEYYIDIPEVDMAFITHAPADIAALLAEVQRLRKKCGESAPEGTEIYHATTNEYVLCPSCESEIQDPWDEPGTLCDGGDWGGVIECRNCEAKIEVYSRLIHFWTARLAKKGASE